MGGITYIDDIDKRKKEEEKKDFISNTSKDIGDVFEGIRKELESRKANNKKKKPLWKKISDIFLAIIILLIIIDLFFGSIWVLIHLTKYFIGFF
jgi:hypothetical protein